tara:strand:- start:800 stop:1558 length:759 start_codon:yes stop_codon:yes gene_type:complete
MFSKEIKFIANKEYVNVSEVLPQPSKLNVPLWFKELNHSINDKTIKGCMPFLDTLTAGYIIKMPVDYYIGHNLKVENEDIHRSTEGFTAISESENSLIKKTNINQRHVLESHPTNQVGEKCPFVNKNKSLPFHKLLNPWIIKTPPGYSCLFLPPMNNSDDRFSIIPGIVDTDTYPSEINFPIIINGDKYPVLETVIKMGTPIAQVFPFKRESWKMVIEEENSEKEQNKRLFDLRSTIINVYKNKWWSKKSWK